MTTTGELRAIIEELQLIDAGDAASYLGEEIAGENAFLLASQFEDVSGAQIESIRNYAEAFAEHASLK